MLTFCFLKDAFVNNVYPLILYHNQKGQNLLWVISLQVAANDHHVYINYFCIFLINLKYLKNYFFSRFYTRPGVQFGYMIWVQLKTKKKKKGLLVLLLWVQVKKRNKKLIKMFSLKTTKKYSLICFSVQNVIVMINCQICPI